MRHNLPPLSGAFLIQLATIQWQLAEKKRKVSYPEWDEEEEEGRDVWWCYSAKDDGASKKGGMFSREGGNSFPGKAAWLHAGWLLRMHLGKKYGAWAWRSPAAAAGCIASVVY